ncbi:hypothetical protein SM124_22260 [Bacillus sp. 31A1R]|uniref:Uncharacterized protein n=1 Tax=Robertmurraya mangrovi TaxID=3098077 RepID=A0ABU5J4V8_9BACI|nr:hypothetical protein [Bacillus sp. 31A1R]MDZ5474422.1 hypothetical protein [Bacillus sp. 31A1R]
MPRKEMIQAFLYGFIFLLFFQVFSVQLAFGNVEDVDSEKQQISKVEPSDSKEHDPDAGGGDVPWWKVIWDKAKEIGQDGLDIISDLGSTISTEWNEFLTDLENSWVGDAWDKATDWLNDAWDWIQETEWIQTIVASILATALIVVAIIVIVGTAPAWGVIAIIGAAALGAGFLYQWIAGDNYSFLGAFGSSLIGGILGYVGYTTGAFATAWLWLRNTAGPAAWNWIRNTAVPWVVGKGRAALTWGRTVAWPWLRGKGIAFGTFLRTQFQLYLTRFRAFYLPNSKLSMGALLLGPGLGMFGGFIGSIAGSLIAGEKITLWKLVYDVAVGGITGTLWAPVFAAGVLLSGSSLLVLGLYGGFESYISDGIKNGEWLKFENFAIGFAVSILSFKGLTFVVDKILKFVGWDHVLTSEAGTKISEEYVKDKIKDLFNGNSGDTGNSGNKEGNTPTNDSTTETNTEENKTQVQTDKKPLNEGNQVNDNDTNTKTEPSVNKSAERGINNLKPEPEF